MMRETNRGAIVMVVNMLTSGGAEKQALWIAETLASQGWGVVVVELVAPRSRSRIDALVKRAGERGVTFDRAAPGGGYSSGLLRIRRLQRDLACRLIWTWGIRADALAALGRLLPPRRTAAWFCSLRNADRDGIRSLRRFYRVIAPRVSLFVANTRANIELLEEYCPGVRARARLLPNVLEELPVTDVMPLPATAPSPLRVAMLGNIDIHRKGYDTAIAVARLVQERGLGLQFVIAGRPDAARWLNEQLDAYRLREVIRYVGEILDPIAFLREADAFLLLSRYEGMPNALLEALVLGLPAVVTAVGDLPHAVTGDAKPFEVVPCAAPEEALAALLRLQSDWPAAVAMGRVGRAWCDANFSPAACAKRVADIVEESLEATPRGT